MNSYIIIVPKQTSMILDKNSAIFTAHYLSNQQNHTRAQFRLIRELENFRGPASARETTF